MSAQMNATHGAYVDCIDGLWLVGIAERCDYSYIDINAIKSKLM